MTTAEEQANLDKVEADKKKALEQIASASLLVRDAVAASLPVGPEQYLTISIPGTVVDTDTFQYDEKTHPFGPPTSVMQAEAKLVDNMTPLATVMLGTTGKSVSRSYGTALDYLVPRIATISTSHWIRSPGTPDYDKAMAYLTTKNATGRTPVDIYIEKQTEWSKAQGEWDKAKVDAKHEINIRVPALSDEEKTQAWNDWAQSHYRIYKSGVQARWIDWVTNGDKYNVEYSFGVIDVDSIMARIENSKQSMRNSTIVDADGANEVLEVELTPKNWAKLCHDKAEGIIAAGPTLDQYQAEIKRLEAFSISLEALQEELNNKEYPKASVSTDKPDVETVRGELVAAYKKLYKQQGIVNGGDTSEAAQTQLKIDRDALQKKLQEWLDKAQEVVKWELSQPGGAEWLANLQKTVADQKAKLEAKLKEKTASKTDLIPTIVSAHKDSSGEGSGSDVAVAGSELANPIFKVNNEDATATTEDPWTKITASFSAKSQETEAKQSSWGFRASAHVSFGLISAGGAYSHEESTSSFREEMSKCDVSVSFSALTVNIARPWLYGELFSDYEIDIGGGFKLSAGPERMHELIKAQGDNDNYVTELAQYNVFPSYPTAFIIAADTVLEFSGDTKHMESHFHSVSNRACLNVGWGPFSASAGFHQQSSSQSFKFESTSTGCKITFGAPQIIAWVSQIMPALPRDANFEPLLQTNNTGVGS